MILTFRMPPLDRGQGPVTAKWDRYFEFSHLTYNRFNSALPGLKFYSL